jgi:hypothetical protein
MFRTWNINVSTIFFLLRSVFEFQNQTPRITALLTRIYRWQKPTVE